MSAPVVAKGYAVVADARFLHAIDARGRERWRYAFDKPKVNLDLATVRKPLVAIDGTIFVVGPDEQLHAVGADGRRDRTRAARRLRPRKVGGPTRRRLRVSPSSTRARRRESLPGWWASPSENRFGAKRLRRGVRESSSPVLLTRRRARHRGDRLRGDVVSMGSDPNRLPRRRRAGTARIERGRHEDLRAVGPGGELILTSRDPTRARRRHLARDLVLGSVQGVDVDWRSR